MLFLLPSGLLGIVLASLAAAFMSTISSHLNWGASYISIDFYKRFMKKNATEKEVVFIGKISTVILMIRRPPRSTLSSSSAASDVYKRQTLGNVEAMSFKEG